MSEWENYDGAAGRIVIAALWSSGSPPRKMPLPPGLLRLRLRYHYPQRCVCSRERASEQARAEACRRLAGRGDQAGGPRCCARFGRTGTLRYCTCSEGKDTSGWVFVRLVVKRPFPRHKPGAVLVAAATLDPTPQSPSLHNFPPRDLQVLPLRADG